METKTDRPMGETMSFDFWAGLFIGMFLGVVIYLVVRPIIKRELGGNWL